MKLQTGIRLSGALALALLSTACVYTPESGTFFDPGVSKAFGGLASRPGATIQLYGFNKNTGAWVQLAQTTAGTTPRAFNDNHTHYYWNVDYRLQNRGDWQCFLSPSCSIPGEGTYEVRFQVKEVNGTAPILYTFDQGGLACWSTNYNSGQDMYAAYWPCRAQYYDEVRLKVAIIW